jgi:hypothetical protein
MSNKAEAGFHFEKADEAIASVVHQDEEVPTPPDQDWTKEEERALVYVP